MLDNIMTWAKENETQIKTAVTVALIGIGAYVLYSGSFDYGYECRKNLEKEAGNGLFEAIEEFANEEI